MPAGQTIASPWLTRVPSLPTCTKPPPEMTTKNVVLGLSWGAIDGVALEGQLGDQAARILVDHGAGHAARSRWAVGPSVSWAETADVHGTTLVTRSGRRSGVGMLPAAAWPPGRRGPSARLARCRQRRFFLPLLRLLLLERCVERCRMVVSGCLYFSWLKKRVRRRCWLYASTMGGK